MMNLVLNHQSISKHAYDNAQISLEIDYVTLPDCCLFVEGSRELSSSYSRVYVGTLALNVFHVEVRQYNFFQNNPILLILLHQHGHLKHQTLILCQQYARNLNLKSFLHLCETRDRLNTDVIGPTLAPCGRCF